MLASILISMLIAFEPLPMDYTSDSQVVAGETDVVTVTRYCEACNTPAHSKVTASGRWVEGYSVASSDYPLGTILYIDGQEYRVDDTGCRSGVIDILTPTLNGECNCDSYEVFESEVIVYVQ